MPPEREIPVEVVYALPGAAHIVSLRVPVGTSLREAVERSGLLQRFPEIDVGADCVGVYGQLCSLDRILRAGDRVEIYRPLDLDAKQARHRRAADHGTH